MKSLAIRSVSAVLLCCALLCSWGLPLCSAAGQGAEEVILFTQMDEETGLYEALKSRYGAIAEERESKLEKAKAIDRFIHIVKSREDLLTEFDPHLWLTTVENVMITSNGKMLFRFFDGTEIYG